MENNKTIYIADDDASIRIAVRAFLENAGYTIEDFENGDLILAAFKQKPCDLMILDIMMPGSRNGFAVLKEVRQFSHVPIIMMTARDSDLDYQTGMDLGADDFFTKPVSPMSIVMRVKAIFRRIDFQWQAFQQQQQH